MKKYLIALALIVATTIYAWAAISSTTHAKLGRNTETFTQTQATVGVAESEIFSARIIAPYSSFAVWIFNTGSSGAFTDLNVLFSDEDANWDEAYDDIGAAGFGQFDLTNCTTTLATDTKCYFAVFQPAPFGWIKITATATTTTESKVVLIGRID